MVGDWEESLAKADCPKCKATLYQSDDCPEIDVDVGGVVRSEDRVRCPKCHLWLGNLVVFQDPNDWTCPNCGVRFGITVF
jgi:ribosomal protein S27AE